MTDRQGSTSNLVRVGMIGCGMIARLHVQRLVADERASVVGLFDTNRATAERLRDELIREARVFDDLATMLDTTPLDAVVICTPTLFHLEQIQACRRRK